MKPLPSPDEAVPCAYASFTCVADDDQGVFRTLLEHALQQAKGRGIGYLMVGLTGSDPLLRTARRFIHIPYRSQVYTASFRGVPGLHERLDGRVPYLELAAV